MPKRKPYFYLIIFTLLTCITILTVSIVYPSVIYQYIWWIVAFFFFITLGIVQFLAYTARSGNKQFMMIYMGTMVARLMVSAMFAGVFIFYDRSHAFIFAINFIILYLLFLGFELYSVLTNLRQHFKKDIGND